jgi:uncharacterized lipoprotein
MKKLLLAVSVLSFITSCKTKKETAQPEKNADSVWEAPKPGVDNPQQYDSLKKELNKRRKNKE